MKRSEQTRIDNLTASGTELAEEHLALVSGGRIRQTYVRDCSVVNGQVVCQLIPD